MAAHTTPRLLLLLRWLGEVSALGCLLLLLEEEVLLVEKAWWCALGGTTVGYFVARHLLRLLAGSLLRSVAQ